MKVNKLLTILLITILILPTISAVVTIVTRTDGLTTPIDYGDLIQFKISGSTAFKPMYITGTVLDENGDIIKEYSETTHNFNSAFRLITVIPSQYGPSGTKTFVGTIRDERGFSKTDTLEFVVNEAAPVLDLNIPDQTLEEDTTITFNLLDYFSDPDRDDLTFSIGSINDMTVSIVNDKNSPVYGQVTIQPDSNWNGQKTNTFMASDGTLSTQSNLVTITVTPVNDQPQGFTVVEDTDEDTPITITLDTLEVDEEDTLTCSIISIWGATETENCVCDDENICTVELTPNQDSTDNVIAFYQLNDGHVDSNFDRIYVTINAINDAPVANDISETTDEDTSKEFHLDCSDVDQNSLTYHIVTDPTSGSIIKSGKKVTYTPNQDYNGDDSFTYKCNDGTVDSNEPTVTINIIPANDPPTTTDDELIVDEDSTSNIIRVLLNDDDIDIVDGDEIHIEDFTQPE
ncbi:MAG: tandem-95 repeat protein, partial [Candidatus Woesearchaeota archaeon]|nr:tandem-95 repeat protein [Candidatus Woesearchaeota archaeon]